MTACDMLLVVGSAVSACAATGDAVGVVAEDEIAAAAARKDGSTSGHAFTADDRINASIVRCF